MRLEGRTGIEQKKNKLGHLQGRDGYMGETFGKQQSGAREVKKGIPTTSLPSVNDITN